MQSYVLTAAGMPVPSMNGKEFRSSLPIFFSEGILQENEESYGTNDNYDLVNGHVFPTFIKRFVAARENRTEEVVWGTGKPLREFLHVDDVANAVYFFLQNRSESEVINIGYGTEVTVGELAEKIAAAGFKGEIKWDAAKPDGMYRKLMDSSKAQVLGWKPAITLDAGIERTIAAYQDFSNGISY